MIPVRVAERTLARKATTMIPSRPDHSGSPLERPEGSGHDQLLGFARQVRSLLARGDVDGAKRLCLWLEVQDLEDPGWRHRSGELDKVPSIVPRAARFPFPDAPSGRGTEVARAVFLVVLCTALVVWLNRDQPRHATPVLTSGPDDARARSARPEPAPVASSRPELARSREDELAKPVTDRRDGEAVLEADPTDDDAPSGR